MAASLRSDSQTGAAALIDVANGQRYPLGPTTTIGRDANSSVVLGDMMVGRRHAEVRQTADGNFELVDLGSRHGTFVGGRRVKEVRLAGGDEILIGSARLRFEPGSSPQDATPIWVDGGLRGHIQRRLPFWEAARLIPASEVADAVELALDYEKLRAALEVTRALAVEHDVGRLMSRLLDAAFSVLPAERGAVILLDGESSGAIAEVARTRSGGEPLILSNSLIQEVLSHRAGVLTADTEVDERFSRSASIVSQGIRSALCVPMLYRGPGAEGQQAEEVLGVIYLDSRQQSSAFGARDLELLTIVAAQAVLAVKNALLVQRMAAVKAAEQRRLEQVVGNLPAGVILLDAERRIRLANPPAERLLALVGLRLGDTASALGALRMDDLLAAGSREVELCALGARRLVVASATSFDSGGERGAVLTLRDVTEERERDLRASHEERLAFIGRAAGSVAHDFNNLLTVILSSTHFLLEDAGDNQAVRADLISVRDAATRAAALTRQLLTFGRRDSVRPAVIDLNAQLEQLRPLLAHLLGASIEIRTRLDDCVPAVKIDLAQLERVVANLAVNARDAMSGGGRLTLETGEVTIADPAEAAGIGLPAAGRYVRLSVADTGVGMTEEVQRRIFEPFFTTKDRGKGTGLGLANVLSAIRQAGGAVRVTSSPGAGTCFDLFLPPAGPACVTGAQPMVTHLGPREATILVAEDLVAVRGLLCRILEQRGHRVLSARDGEEALAIAARHAGPIDLLVSDIAMPRVNGLALAERLTATRPGLPVLFVSGQAADDPDAQAAAGPGRAFLAKPFTVDELIDKVRIALEANRS